MKSTALRRFVNCLIILACGLTPKALTAQSCKCPRNPGPGGGVQCASNQIATCDPTSGECNCTCDSAQQGKTKAEYEAQIFSKVLHTQVNVDELSDPQFKKFVSSFHKDEHDVGTFKFDKETGANTKKNGQVEVGVPGWLEEVLRSNAPTTLGPGASLQNCPNGICIGGDNIGNPSVTNNYNAEPVERKLSKEQAVKLVEKLSATPAPFWMMIGSTIHGHEGHIQENVDEQGKFELLLEGILTAAQWEDFLQTSCKDVKNLINPNPAASQPRGEIPLARWPLRGSKIDASLFPPIAGCPYPVYEEPEHGILIESPEQFLGAAELLNAELANLLIRSSVRRADVFDTGGKELRFIIIHIGTT